MKGNIMDKKILLGGAAALLLVGNMYATPASAAIDLSIGGEAKLTGAMSECGPDAEAANDLEEMLEAHSGSQIGVAAAATSAEVDTYITGTIKNTTAVAMTATDEDLEHKYIAGPCAGADRSGIDWGFGKKLTISASGTLANGLEVSFSDELNLTSVAKEEEAFDLTLGGAFGSLQFKTSAPSAVDAAMVTGKKDLDVNGTNLGFHDTETSGSAGMGILWNAPSMGDLDLYLSWAPNSGGDGLNNAAYENTFGFGAVMNTSAITIGAGYEAASADATNGKCKEVVADDYHADQTAQQITDTIFGGDYCGDQTLMYVGATMDASNIGINIGYSVLDTDEADKTVMSIGASTTVSDIDVSIDYRNTVKDYEFGASADQDEQTVIALGLGTSLGDGVDLGLSFSTADTSLLSESMAGGGDTNYYFAEASLTVGF
jgi:hypothetical protein